MHEIAGSPLLLDGPIGTELARLGVPTDGPQWSAAALRTHPDVIRDIHAAYARAGATVHTANSFRARRLPRWREAARTAVALARAAVPPEHRIAGGIAPVGDCYAPHTWSPALAHRHAVLAEVLAEAGADLLLCETFAHPDEARAATLAAARTGLEVWTALTAGPWARLLAPEALAEAAEGCMEAGASLVLVNCVAATGIAPYVDALADRGLPFGVYANAGDRAEGIGFCAHPDTARYADLALDWVARGARVIGGCCGTSPAHIAAVHARLRAAIGGATPTEPA